MSNSGFCPDCQNLLYPREDREYRQLLYFCNSCSYMEYADPKIKEKNTVEFTAFNYRTKDDIHSYIPAGLADDPTLPRAPTRVCSQCNHVGAVYLQLPDRVADEAMVMVYVCSECNYFEMDNAISASKFQAEEEPDEQEELEEHEQEEEITLKEDEDDDDLFGEMEGLVIDDLDEDLLE